MSFFRSFNDMLLTGVFVYAGVYMFMCSCSYWGVQNRAEKLMMNGIRQVF
jgi:hypothetical protein